MVCLELMLLRPTMLGRWGIQSSVALSRHLILHWDGQQWSQVPSPSPGPNWNILLGVSSLASNDIWAAGSYFTGPCCSSPSIPLAEHWDGSSWSVIGGIPQNSDQPHFVDIKALAPDLVWAVGLNYTAGTDWALADRYANPCSTPTLPPTATLYPTRTSSPTPTQTSTSIPTSTGSPSQPPTSVASSTIPSASATQNTPAPLTSTSTNTPIGTPTYTQAPRYVPLCLPISLRVRPFMAMVFASRVMGSLVATLMVPSGQAAR